MTVACPSPPPPPPRAFGPPELSSRRILSVEDVAVNQELVRLFLDGDDLSVERVADGASALTALQDRRFDLVLLDLRLPDIDGLQIARLVRAGEALGVRMPILAVTADVAPASVAGAYAAGVDEVLAKPFTAAALRAAVARRLDARPPAEPRSGAAAEIALDGALARIGRLHGQPIVTRLLSAFMLQLDRMAMLDDGEARAVGAQAHAVKGAAANLGFGDVSAACGALENICRRGEDFHGQLRAAASTCGRVRGEIEDRLKLAA